ncbi:MAG: alpha/beta hydrolase [Chloroflexota bacterium]
MEEIRVLGLRIAYERAGRGPALVLLHGFAGDSREWRGQIDELSDEFTVVAWDAPGAGRSDDPPPSFRMADYADCLAEVIGALNLERPHIAGLSFGSALALELYRRHPSVPRTLILAGAYAGWTGSLPTEVRDARLRRSLELAEQVPAEFVAGMIPTLFPESTPKAMIDGFSTIVAQFHPDGFRTLARSLAEADLRDVLPRIRVPTLLVYGDRDVRASLDVAEALHTAIPESILVILPGVGHMSNVQAGDKLNHEVRQFLHAS